MEIQKYEHFVIVDIKNEKEGEKIWVDYYKDAKKIIENSKGKKILGFTKEFANKIGGVADKFAKEYNETLSMYHDDIDNRYIAYGEFIK